MKALGPPPPFGSSWRLLAHRGSERIELEDQGLFDELVVDDWIHLEQMEENIWWVRLGDARITITLAPGEQAIVDICRGAYSPTRGETTNR
jgi:hypothetical protein